MPSSRVPGLVAVAVLATAGLAAPRPLAADPIGVAVDATMGGGLYTGEIADAGAGLAPHVRVGVGVARGPWAGLVDLEMANAFGLREAMSDAQPAPPTIDFIGLGLGPSVRRELTRGAGLRVHLRVAYTWRWLYGGTEARRTCSVHSDCAGGFWTETPTYSAHGPTLAIGVSARSAQRVWMAVGLELAVGHRVVDRRGHDPDLAGTFITLGLNLAVGRDHR